MIDDAALQALPQSTPVGLLAQRGSALVLGGAIRDLLSGEGEVVGARLHGDVQALLLGPLNRLQGLSTGQVQDVYPGPGLASGLEDVLDRGVLSLRWTRSEVVCVTRTELLRGGGEDLGVLGMHDHDRPQAGDLLQVLLDLPVRQTAVLIDAGVGREALEAEDPFLPQGGEVLLVAGNCASPEADVDGELSGCGSAFELELVHVHCWRVGVEGHVENRCDSPGQSCASGAFVAFPLGPPRLVDVDVGVQ